MASQLAKELIDAGIHYGHRTSRWNPKMKPYIFGKRNAIHIIDVRETLKGLFLAKKFITGIVTDGKDLLIVGTKRQARKSIEEQATAIGMHYANDRWLGGTLTNFHEIRKRVGRLSQLEQLETEGMLDTYSKKEGASLRREMRKIRRNLGGIRNMTRLPGALFIIDQVREIIAIREARKMGIPVVCLLDTDCDPDMVDIPIPGNDDAMRSIELITRELCQAAAEGLGMRAKRQEQAQVEVTTRRRSHRPATAKADQTLQEQAEDVPQPESPPVNEPDIGEQAQP